MRCIHFAAVVAWLGLCGFSKADIIPAEQLRQTGATDTSEGLTLQRPDLFSSVESSVLVHELPVLPLLNGRRFPISTEIANLPAVNLPVAFVSAAEVHPTGAIPRYGSDATGGVLNLRTDRWRTGGELGVFYGKSSGKYGREDFQAYGIGTIANDKVSLTVGVMHQESHGREFVPTRYTPQR